MRQDDIDTRLFGILSALPGRGVALARHPAWVHREIGDPANPSIIVGGDDDEDGDAVTSPRCDQRR